MDAALVAARQRVVELEKDLQMEHALVNQAEEGLVDARNIAARLQQRVEGQGTIIEVCVGGKVGVVWCGLRTCTNTPQELQQSVDAARQASQEQHRLVNPMRNPAVRKLLG